MDERLRHLTEGQLALQACASCRKGKRACSKRLPACDLCVRLGRSCDYTADIKATPPSAEDFIALRQQVSDLQSLIASQSRNDCLPGSIKPDGESNGDKTCASGNDVSISGQELSPSSRSAQPTFNSMFFLDSNLFTYTRLTIQPPHITVPPTIVAALGDASELQDMVERYFTTAHTYFPIISKIRLYQHLANPSHQPGATLALLFLAMKLSCLHISDEETAWTPLYQDVKAFYQFVEAHNGFCIQSIQALLLIALYEIGHGVYPAAYLSIGSLARVGYACGLHSENAPQILPRPTTWTEQEERRRLWWGIVILDRFVHIGNRGKPFTTMDPSIECHLPVDDESWDKGQMLVAAPLSLSASPTVNASPFARTCQAAYLLGRALRHIDDSHLPIEYRFDEALQLHRTMRAFADAVEFGETSHVELFAPPRTLATSLAIIYSALLTLYDAYSCTSASRMGGGEAQLRMQKESIEGLKGISDRVLRFVQELRVGGKAGGLQHMSPLMIDSIYQAAANYAWYHRESSDAICNERLLELKDSLTMLRGRWKIAGEYERIVESWQYTPITGAM